jgi:hypothetical protein
MDEIDIAEFNTRAAAAFSLSGLEDARRRAHALLLVLLAGGGSLGMLGLGKWNGEPILSVATLSASAYWFLGAAWVAWSGLSTAPVRSWATPGLLAKFDEWKDYAKQARVEDPDGKEDAIDPITELRKSAIRNAELAAHEYRNASTKAHRTLDTVFRMTAATPLVSLLCAWVFSRCG